jgi:hypothetical protein
MLEAMFEAIGEAILLVLRFACRVLFVVLGDVFVRLH